VRKISYEANFNYTTDPDDNLETREAQGQVRFELENGDSLSTEYTRSFEALDEGFEVASAVFIPPGAYTFQQMRASYNFGPQRPVSGWLSVTQGSFYGGDLTEVSWRGRADITSTFYLEPTISWNHFDGPWGKDTTELVSTRATYTLSPRMFVAALVQFQSSSDAVSTNARFRWEYLPGSELFVVYSDGRTTSTPGFPRVQNRSFVVKVTRLMRW
jgi:hypothetical protein